jgi:uncharacterized protein
MIELVLLVLFILTATYNQNGEITMKRLVMKTVKKKHFKYHLYEPIIETQSRDTVIIFYHGYGMKADNYEDVAKEMVNVGFTVIIPDIIYHDSRNPLDRPFDTQTIQKYFWKTIFETIDEFDDFMNVVGISKDKIVLVGSSMGGFIVNGISANQKELKGLADINGSGSFLVAEQLFRQKDKRGAISLEEAKLLSSYDPVGKDICEAPILLIHGEQDSIVSIEGKEHYYSYLINQKNSNKVKYLVYQDVNHQFTMEMLVDLVSWLKRL